MRKLPQPIVADIVVPRTLKEFFQRCKFYQFYEKNLNSDSHLRIGDKAPEFKFIMQQLGSGECWFPSPSNSFCKIVQEEKTGI
ncbi:MAG: hypothetical protein ACE5R6_16715 [Candidatus Heimdallarchaeota archaeon]